MKLRGDELKFEFDIFENENGNYESFVTNIFISLARIRSFTFWPNTFKPFYSGVVMKGEYLKGPYFLLIN